MKFKKRYLSILILLLVCAAAVFGAEVMPPPPTQYVNDYAGVMSKSAVAQLNQQLMQFEKQTSNQILVAIYPKMQSDSSVADYTVRIANSWKAGQKNRDNGAILFVFIQQRKMFIQVGYGLEGALPDALCNEIIDLKIKPAFKRGNYTAGVTAGVEAMMAATRGEYKGTGHLAEKTSPAWILILLFFIFFFFISRMTVYGGRGRRRGWFWGPAWFLGGFGAGGGFGGGGFGGGGFGGGGGGGGFTGGGGGFGGGGAGGSW